MLQVDAFVESPGTEAVIASESSGVDGHCVLPEITFIFLLLRDKAEDWKDNSFIIGLVFLYHFSPWIPCVASGLGKRCPCLASPPVLVDPGWEFQLCWALLCQGMLPVPPGLVFLNLRSLD